jgi:hypothetical protein
MLGVRHEPPPRRHTGEFDAAIAAARLVAMAASVAAVSIVARRLGTGSYGVFSCALNCVLLVQCTMLTTPSTTSR